jgi:cytoskeletal protein RodZ
LGICRPELVEERRALAHQYLNRPYEQRGMVKPIVIAVAGFVAALWIACGYLWWNPDTRQAMTAIPASPQPERLAEYPTPASTSITPIPPQPVAKPVVPALSDEPASMAASVRREAATDDSPELKRIHAAEVAEREAALAQSSKAPPASAQYTGAAGYVFDGDSVVIAPPAPAEGANDHAAKQRALRLSIDVATIP